MDYSAEAYLSVFTGSVEHSDPRETLGHKLVMRYRTKVTTSGPVIETDSYPIWSTRGEASRAREGKQKSRDAQVALNEKNARLRVVRLANANFTKDDLFLTVTFEGTEPDVTEAQRKTQNFVRRLRGLAQRLGLPEVRYTYCIEFPEEGGKGAGACRVRGKDRKAYCPSCRRQAGTEGREPIITLTNPEH